MFDIVTSARAFGLQVCDCEKIDVMATAFIFDSQMKCFSLLAINVGSFCTIVMPQLILFTPILGSETV